MSVIDERSKPVQLLKPNEVVKVYKETHIPTVEELVEKIGRRYKRLRPRKRGKRGLIEFELQRLQLVYNIVRSVFERIASLPQTRRMNDFHRALIREMVGGDYDKAIERARFILKMLDKIWDDYRLLISTAESPAEAARFRREASGRIISLWRRYKRHLEVLLKVKQEILHTHVVSEELPVTVVAGIPSAGKSTLIASLSTAKPEIAPYPFTTKTIIVGKMRCNPLDIYLVDTPGILDRPYEELNEIERKAYVALKTLPNLVIFLIDVSPERSVDIDGQLKLLEQIRRDIAEPRGARIYVAVNKVDNAESDALEKTVRWLRERGYEYLTISALKGLNLDKLRELICKEAVKHYLNALAQYPQLVGRTASQAHPEAST